MSWFAEAARTGAGRREASGRTAIAGKAHVGSNGHGQSSWSDRLCIVKVMLHHSFPSIFGSGYGHTTLGPSGASLAFVEELREAVASVGCPFVLGADWNIDTEQLATSQWAVLLGATV
eukprot:9412008-Pyramimonas_sp.AAC.1